MGLAIIVPSISFDDANLGKVTLSGNVPIRDLYINLENYYTGTEVDLKCSYLPVNTTQRDVVWSIESGSEYASISGSTLTILPGALNNDVTIKCASSINPNIVAEKTITVTYDGSGEYILKLDNYTLSQVDKRTINLWDNSHPVWTIFFNITINTNTESGKVIINSTSISTNNNRIEGFKITSDTHSVQLYLQNDKENRGWSFVMAKNKQEGIIKFGLQKDHDELYLVVTGDTWSSYTNLSYKEDMSGGIEIGGSSDSEVPRGIILNQFYIFSRLLTVQELKNLY